jgi:hypothetical protein
MFETIFNNDNKNYQWRTTVIFSVSGYKKTVTKAVFSMQILREETGTLLSIYVCVQDFNCIKCNKTTDICHKILTVNIRSLRHFTNINGRFLL